MADEMIWQVINHQFCSFKTTIGKAKSDKTHFCKHPYSVTGLCNRTSCPLANSRYATLREDNGRVYLCVKTVERAHTPKNMWEKILLSRNYAKALAQIDEHLQYFPKVLIHRNKQRLTKIHQYLIRMRKIELKLRSGRKAKMVGIPRKIEQREERRERKALVAAKIEKNISQELVGRLAKGTYGDIYNFHETAYKKALEQGVEENETAQEVMEDEETATELTTEEGEVEYESDQGEIVEYVEELESDDEEEDEDEEEFNDDLDYLGNGQWGDRYEDESGSSDEENDVERSDESSSSGDDDDSSSSASDEDGDEGKKKTKRDKKKKPDDKKRRPDVTRPRGPRIEIEYEEEREDDVRQNEEGLMSAAGTAW